MTRQKSTPLKDRVIHRLTETKKAVQDPSYAWHSITGALLSTWRTRGGGWYGVGYLVTLLYWEIRMLIDDIVGAGAGGVVELVTSQLGQLVFRWFTESIVNMVQAFLWPLRLLETMGTIPGIVLLVAIHYFFELWVRPLAEIRFPELREDRQAKDHVKAEKAAAKEKKRRRKES